MTKSDYRLPEFFIPKEYAIDITASLARSTFLGELILTGKLTQATPALFLHAKDMTFQKVNVKVGKKSFNKAKITYHKANETVELSFKEPLPKGQVTLTIAYKGTINQSLQGLYLAKDGNEKALVSQCEAPFARAIFPCLDEPNFKATLQWTVRTDKPDLTVITNGILQNVKKSRGQFVHTFKPTRVIPTYLAAITIGNYETSKTIKVNGTPCRALAGIGKAQLTGFAQEVTQFVLPWYENYFAQKYNYQKLDQVAVPGFDAGAMENVGAIFYRQSLLLMDPVQTSWNAQKRIAEVIAHEIAHQWFGNLVTMKWWDDLWLNEAFATWIAYKVVDIWKPNWRLWDDYLESKEGALAADALVNTHPVYSEVKSPAEATELFDVITYEKGCAILRMAENYLGEKVFQKGMQAYQAAFKNSNAKGQDLWNKLAEASSQPVDALMQSWVTQSGFPLLSVRFDKNKLVLQQRRYFAHPSEIQKPNEQQWLIPLVIRCGNTKETMLHRHLLTEKSDTVVLPPNATWVFPNANSSGFYRLHLDDAALKNLLTEGLQYLAPSERKSLIEDEWALVRCGLTSVDRFMDVLTALRNDKDHIVVRTLESRLSTIEHRLVRDEDRELLREYARYLFSPQLAELGFDKKDNELPEYAVRRAATLRVLGDIGRDKNVLEKALLMHQQELADAKNVDANIAGTVIALCGLNGDVKLLETYVETFLKRKKAKAAPDLQSRYLNALPAFENTKAIQKILTLCMNDTIPQEQLRVILSPMLASKAAQIPAWEFLKKHWKVMAPKIGAMGISRLVETTGALPYSLRKDIETFFTKNETPEAKRALQKALEAMDLRHELVTREAAKLGAWLRKADIKKRVS